MNKFIKLSKINKDIELLENAGKIKSAEVLHNKFIRIAQSVSNEVKTPKKFMDELYLLAGNSNNDFEELVKWYKNDPGRYSEEEREYIDKAVETATDRRKRLGKFTTVINPDNPTLIKEETEDGNKNTVTENDNNDNTKKPKEQKIPILDEREQRYVYRRIVKQIKRLLVKKLNNKADKLALDYQDYFENPKRNIAFITQVNNIYKELNLQSPL